MMGRRFRGKPDVRIDDIDDSAQPTSRRGRRAGGPAARILAFAALLVAPLAVAGGMVGAVSPASANEAQALWVPAPDATFDYRLGGAGNPPSTGAVDVIVLDGEATSAEQVARWHAAGSHVVCYVNGGAWEPYRSDSASFPEQLRGQVMDGWEDERWLDIRARGSLLQLMAARVDACADKGFDAVEFDNVDGYTNETGFPLTAWHQLNYNRGLAALAHERGLSAALKNDVDQIGQLVASFDFAINEECLAYEECDAYEPFVKEGKAVFNIEYETIPGRCRLAAEAGMVSIRANLDLSRPGVGCPRR